MTITDWDYDAYIAGERKMEAVAQQDVPEYAVDDRFLDEVRTELFRNPNRWTSSNPRLVAAIRFLIEVRQYTSAQVLLRLNVNRTTNAVIGFCHRTKPPIKYPRVRRSMIDHGSNNVSTHFSRLIDKVEGSKPDLSDPDLEKRCPTCGAAPGFRCVTVHGSNQKRFVTKTHKERLPADRHMEPWEKQLAAQRSRRASRLKAPVVCTWFGCTEPPLDSRPYCLTHLHEAGYIVSAKPINFSKKAG